MCICLVSIEQFICDGEIFLCIFCSMYVVCWFEINGFFYVYIMDYFYYDVCVFWCCVYSYFIGRGFDEVCICFDGDFRCFMDQCFVFQFVGFDDYFQQYICCCVSFFIGFYQVKINLFVICYQCVVWEYYVNFIGIVGDCCMGFCQCDFDVIVIVWEVGYCSNMDFWGVLFFQCFVSNWDKVRIDIDSGGIVDWGFGLMIQSNYFFVGVVVIQGGQVY